MPFVSQAQRAKFYADPKLRPMAAKWEAHTPKGLPLPEHVKKTAKPKKRRAKKV